jgi:Ni2+-binding GTPase involved in maturation of urease and hydrogenase
VIADCANDGVDIVMLENAGYRLNVCLVDLEDLYAVTVVTGLSTVSVSSPVVWSGKSVVGPQFHVEC